MSEIQELRAQILHLFENYREDEIDDLPLVIKYKKLFEKNPHLAQRYISESDAYNPEKVNENMKDIKIEVSTAGLSNFEDVRKIIVMDDGSFVVLDSQIEVIDQITSYDDEFVIASAWWWPFGSFRNKNIITLVRLWPGGELHLNTDFTLNSSGIIMTSTDHQGTYSNFPSFISDISTWIHTSTAYNEGGSTRSRGSYKETHTLGSRWYYLNTYIELTVKGTAGHGITISHIND